MALEEHILERAGANTHYWLGGKAGAPLVAFTHGATIDHHEWDADLPAVMANFRVLVWDVRAHGLSRPAAFHFQDAVDDLAALIERHSDAPVMLVGHSMGGNLSQELAFQHPELARAMLCLDCTWNFQRLSALEKAGLAAAGPIFKLYPYETLIRQSLDVTVTNPQGRDVSGARHAPAQQGRVHCRYAGPGKVPARRTRLRLRQPTVAADGRAGKHRQHQQSHAAVGGEHEPLSRFIVVPGAKHAANLDNPEFFQKKLLEFLHSLKD